MIEPQVQERLIAEATRSRGNAVAGRSGFSVGAAIEAEDGRIFGGCNVENATYGLTVCAERVAIWKALSEGVRAFRAVAVVTGADVPTPPCGACRQILWEFAGDVPVVSATEGGKTKQYRMSELLPEPFDLSRLRGGKT
ncbi:MAG TPA: cytidine deaminase [Thermoanaerobaculia bacterium]|nr:cytidine deaminase [Thermoanaerobaculia bacterium]